MTPDEYLEMICDSAKEVCGAYGLPWQCCVAQGAIESQWGTYGIGNGNFNIFGRKWGGEGDYVTVDTQEDDGTGNLYTITAKFQSYQSISEAIKDWCVLITEEPCYAGCLDYRDDLEGFVRALAPIYATDIYYGDKIMSTIRACDL